MEKMNVKLYSVKPEEYPDIENYEVDFLDNLQELDGYTKDKYVAAVKTKPVKKAVPAKAGQVVETNSRVIVGGKVYTFSEVIVTVTPEQEQAGAMVVTNPDGENYLIKSKAIFNSKYSKGEDGTFIPTDAPKNLVEVTKPCAIEKWGSVQIVPEGSYIMLKDDGSYDYSITNAAFEATYSTDPADIAKRDEEIAKRNEEIAKASQKGE